MRELYIYYNNLCSQLTINLFIFKSQCFTLKATRTNKRWMLVHIFGKSRSVAAYLRTRDSAMRLQWRIAHFRRLTVVTFVPSTSRTEAYVSKLVKRILFLVEFYSSCLLSDSFYPFDLVALLGRG